MVADNPMGTSLLIPRRFVAEIPRVKFVEISSVLKAESTWKFRRGFDFENRHNIDESPRGFFHVVSMSNRRNFCTCCFHSIVS